MIKKIIGLIIIFLMAITITGTTSEPAYACYSETPQTPPVPPVTCT